MARFKDGSSWSIVLVLVLAAGCASAPQRRSSPSPRLAAADTKPLPSLQIPGAPPPPPATPEVVPAAAKVPPPPDPRPNVTPDLPRSAAPDSFTLPNADDSSVRLRELHRLAAESYASVDSYIVRLRRREQINGKDRPEEVLLFKFRKQPWSVYFKWLGNEGCGREVTYVQGRYDNKITTLLAAGDMPFMPAGKRIALAPDNAFVRSSSRHAITEAGVGHLINSFGQLVEGMAKGDPRQGTLRYLGVQKRPELEKPGEMVEQKIPPGAEPQLPHGGRRLWLFDPANHFPVLLLTYDEAGHEVEFYCYDRFQYPVKLDDDDFNPDKLGTTPATGRTESVTRRGG